MKRQRSFAQAEYDEWRRAKVNLNKGTFFLVASLLIAVALNSSSADTGMPGDTIEKQITPQITASIHVGPEGDCYLELANKSSKDATLHYRYWWIMKAMTTNEPEGIDIQMRENSGNLIGAGVTLAGDAWFSHRSSGLSSSALSGDETGNVLAIKAGQKIRKPFTLIGMKAPLYSVMDMKFPQKRCPEPAEIRLRLRLLTFDAGNGRVLMVTPWLKWRGPIDFKPN